MKVRPYTNLEYEVIDENYNHLFKGSLADCEAFIRLTEGGHM